MQNINLQEIEAIKEILRHSQHTVFFGGAGVSTDSGIPDFRGNDGLYADKEERNEYYLSKECLAQEPEKFFAFFRSNMLFADAQPNDAHIALANLEKQGILKAIITQNIDGLHQKAGSQRVIELHGTASRCYCGRCGKVYDGAVLTEMSGVPHCTACGAVIRPDVTLYGEPLDGFNFADAEEEVSQADVLIVGGSSLVVHPAASLISAYQGDHLIIINYSPTPYDGLAEFVIRDSLSQVLRSFADE